MATVEIWKPVIGFEGSYEVSDMGRVRSLDKRLSHWRGGFRVRRGTVLKPGTSRGYLHVTLSDQGVHWCRTVHRLVAIHFLPPSDLPEINHKDLNKANNMASNLEWASRKANYEHAKAEGVFTALTNPNMAKKLTPKLVDEIRASRTNGMTYRSIASKFNINIDTATKIVKERLWAPWPV